MRFYLEIPGPQDLITKSSFYSVQITQLSWLRPVASTLTHVHSHVHLGSQHSSHRAPKASLGHPVHRCPPEGVPNAEEQTGPRGRCYAPPSPPLPSSNLPLCSLSFLLSLPLPPPPKRHLLQHQVESQFLPPQQTLRLTAALLYLPSKFWQVLHVFKLLSVCVSPARLSFQ